jgi:hypothetical protein
MWHGIAFPSGVAFCTAANPCCRPGRAHEDEADPQNPRSSPRKRGPRGQAYSVECCAGSPSQVGFSRLAHEITPTSGRPDVGPRGRTDWLPALPALLIQISNSQRSARRLEPVRAKTRQGKRHRPVSLRRRVRRRLGEDPRHPGQEPRARGTPGVAGAHKFTPCAQTRVLGPTGLDASRHRGLSSVVECRPSLAKSAARHAASPPNPRRPARGVYRLAPHRPR